MGINHVPFLWRGHRLFLLPGRALGMCSDWDSSRWDDDLGWARDVTIHNLWSSCSLHQSFIHNTKERKNTRKFDSFLTQSGPFWEQFVTLSQLFVSTAIKRLNCIWLDWAQLQRGVEVYPILLWFDPDPGLVDPRRPSWCCWTFSKSRVSKSNSSLNQPLKSWVTKPCTERSRRQQQGINLWSPSNSRVSPQTGFYSEKVKGLTRVVDLNMPIFYNSWTISNKNTFLNLSWKPNWGREQLKKVKEAFVQESFGGKRPFAWESLFKDIRHTCRQSFKLEIQKWNFQFKCGKSHNCFSCHFLHFFFFLTFLRQNWDCQKGRLRVWVRLRFSLKNSLHPIRVGVLEFRRTRVAKPTAVVESLLRKTPKTNVKLKCSPQITLISLKAFDELEFIPVKGRPKVPNLGGLDTTIVRAVPIGTARVNVTTMKIGLNLHFFPKSSCPRFDCYIPIPQRLVSKPLSEIHSKSLCTKWPRIPERPSLPACIHWPPASLSTAREDFTVSKLSECAVPVVSILNLLLEDMAK